MTVFTEAALPGRIHVIGAGLIGTSVALAARRAGVQVSVEDVDSNHEQLAAQRWGSVSTLDTSPSAEPEIVLVATPPQAAAEVLASASSRWPDATLTDVSSVKVRPLQEAINLGADPRRLVGGHPMAGGEMSGPAAAHAHLFDDRVWVLCPTPESDPGRVTQLENLVGACGAVVLIMQPHTHDHAVALTSHVPQVMSSILAGALVNADVESLRLVGQGLRDMTRIASSNPAMWTEILEMNGTEVAPVLEYVMAEIMSLTRSLTGDEVAKVNIDRTLRLGVAGRDRIPGKHGAAEREFATVTVQVKDEPGQLADLFVAAGRLGVNLEDVRIEHVLGRPSGLIDLYVRPQLATVLMSGLTEQGFDLRS